MDRRLVIHGVVLAAVLGVGGVLPSPCEAQPQSAEWTSQEQGQAEAPRETGPTEEGPREAKPIRVDPQRPAERIGDEPARPFPERRTGIQLESPQTYERTRQRTERPAQPTPSHVPSELGGSHIFDDLDARFNWKYHSIIVQLEDAAMQQDQARVEALGKELAGLLAKEQPAPYFCDGCYWCWPSCDDPVICFCPGGGCGDIIFERGCMR